MTIPLLDEQQVLNTLRSQTNPYFQKYYAFYSSWMKGIVTAPHLMLLSIDDHMVHRGDGIFEAMKSVNRSVYQLDQHLQRLATSADRISLKLPMNLSELKEIILATLKAANQNHTVIRLFVSRGPGNFSVNPYDAIASQLYIVVTELNSPSDDTYLKGVNIGKSALPSKSPWMAEIKSCNYLPNVLMKKESVDRDLDYVFGLDDEGYVTECPTENILIVDENGTLVHPMLNQILQGTTMLRACELARDAGIQTAIRNISVDQLHTAREILITGTTLDVLPVVRYENHLIGNGQPGPIATKLNKLMKQDIAVGNRRTIY
jgi:branched-subunit amino acid aminotransferase/4-amino-4-deoxychorismate lyase